MPSSPGSARLAFSAPHMMETFLNRDQAAACCSCADSVARSHSILTLHNFATAEEVAVLKAEALAAAHARDQADANSDESARRTEQLICEMRAAYIKAGQPWRTRTAVPSGSDAATHRLQVEMTLAGPGQALCDALLLRALSQIDEQLVQDLFGDCTTSSPGTVAKNPQLTFSTNEPAINVYFRGDSFKVHEDKHALTVLVPLSSADSEFEGGGTAFWSHADARPAKYDLGPPTMVLRPPAGAALLWGGNVTHAGLPVQSGQRCVFVASFSPKESPAAAAAKRTATEGQASPTSRASAASSASHRRMAEILSGR